MQRMIALFILVVALLAIALPAMAEGSKPVQLALVTPVQLVHEKYAVSGIRINLLYGRNTGMTGLDWGLVNHTTGDFGGLSLAAVSLVDGNAKGIQYSIYNSAGHMTGIQLGWVNVAGEMKGVQLGLINIIKRGGILPFFPIINAGF